MEECKRCGSDDFMRAFGGGQIRSSLICAICDTRYFCYLDYSRKIVSRFNSKMTVYWYLNAVWQVTSSGIMDDAGNIFIETNNAIPFDINKERLQNLLNFS